MRQASRGTNEVRVNNNNRKPCFSILLRALPFSAKAAKAGKIFLLLFTMLFECNKVNTIGGDYDDSSS